MILYSYFLYKDSNLICFFGKHFSRLSCCVFAQDGISNTQAALNHSILLYLILEEINCFSFLDLLSKHILSLAIQHIQINQLSIGLQLADSL